MRQGTPFQAAMTSWVLALKFILSRPELTRPLSGCYLGVLTQNPHPTSPLTPWLSLTSGAPR